MPRLRDQPIPKKITFVIMAITAVVLLLAFSALFYFQACILRQHATHELAVVGEITARECGGAVRFKDEDAARQILSGLKAMPQVVSARLELINHQRLAFFGTPSDEAEIKAARLISGFRINGDRIILAQPVTLGGTQEGTLSLLADLRATTSQLLKLYGSLFTLVLVASLLVAFVLSGQFLHFVTNPILRLADTARTVADHNDYSVRATKTCNDEAGILTDAFNQMLDQIESQDHALRKAEEKYRLIFENAVEGVFQTTPEGKFISVNPALARMFGYDSPEDLITSVTDIGQTLYVNPLRRDEFKQAIETHGSVELFEYEIFRKDKSTLWLCENSRAVRDSEGKVCYYEGTVEDITQRKRVEEVERASKAKSEFLSRMSHELRTPLNAILGFGQLLERQTPTPVQKNRIAHILSAGRHLLNLINEILDIARVESGRFQLSLEPVVVDQAVDEAIELIRPMAADRNIEIERSALPETSPNILADRQRLKQVLLNLLSNAVKYNRHSGHVIVDLAPQDGGRFRISISDEGPGIPPDKRARLFSPFDRLGAENSETQGTGLGLALSKRLTEAMGGAIGEGGPAMGACFWIEFPIVKGVHEQVPTDGAAVVELGPVNGARTLLYIEDNLSNLSLIENLLSECAPIKLMSAMQGQLGIELATRHQPDLILLDVHLPDINGADVLARLKARPRTRDIPVVVLSADATRSQMNRLLALGANDYLTKPLDVDCFLKVIEDHFCEPVASTTNGDGP